MDTINLQVGHIQGDVLLPCFTPESFSHIPHLGVTLSHPTTGSHILSYPIHGSHSLTSYTWESHSHPTPGSHILSHPIHGSHTHIPHLGVTFSHIPHLGVILPYSWELHSLTSHIWESFHTWESHFP